MTKYGLFEFGIVEQCQVFWNKLILLFVHWPLFEILEARKDIGFHVFIDNVECTQNAEGA